MSSAVVDYRSAVVASIEANVIGLNKVDWYDALFDEDDVNEWSLMTPCAFVAARDVKGLMHSTGEINLGVDMVAVVVTADIGNRDADLQNWALLEQIVILVDYNFFGDIEAAVPTNLSFARLREPELRKMGVALGIVEWTAGLTIGTNQVLKNDTVVDPATGQPVTTFPQKIAVSTTIGGAPAETVPVGPSLMEFWGVGS